MKNVKPDRPAGNLVLIYMFKVSQFCLGVNGKNGSEWVTVV